MLLTGTRELVRKQHQSLLAQGAEAIDLSLIYTDRRQMGRWNRSFGMWTLILGWFLQVVTA
mgnify:CR=1 FL=1